jgi:hypothetical protein
MRRFYVGNLQPDTQCNPYDACSLANPPTAADRLNRAAFLVICCGDGLFSEPVQRIGAPGLRLG